MQVIIFSRASGYLEVQICIPLALLSDCYQIDEQSADLYFLRTCIGAVSKFKNTNSKMKCHIDICEVVQRMSPFT